VRRAHGAGLAALALTDHDTMAGLDEAAGEARRLGLGFVPGCEISVTVGGQDIHVLAYFADPADPSLARLLRDAERMRGDRVRETVSRLQRAGVGLSVEDVFAQAASSRAAGRLHVARALIARGLVASVAEAFQRYLGAGACACVPKRTPSIDAALAAVWGSGAVPVLAHPGLYGPECPESFFADWDLGGLEVRHPGHSPEAERRFEAWARERSWIATGGSDWHGDERPAAYLGSRAVDAAAVEALRQRSRRPASQRSGGKRGACERAADPASM
jgi:predicted metal-dependent phosphoesterase TrpH